MWSELASLPSAAQPPWRSALANALACQFQYETLSAALRSFRRLVQWLSDKDLPLQCPCTSDLPSFLLEQSKRGRTVPAATLCACGYPIACRPTVPKAVNLNCPGGGPDPITCFQLLWSCEMPCLVFDTSTPRVRPLQLICLPPAHSFGSF